MKHLENQFYYITNEKEYDELFELSLQDIPVHSPTSVTQKILVTTEKPNCPCVGTFIWTRHGFEHDPDRYYTLNFRHFDPDLLKDLVL